MESKKYNKSVNITKKQTHRYIEQTSGYHWGAWRSNIVVGKWEVQILAVSGDVVYKTENNQYFIITVNEK